MPSSSGQGEDGSIDCSYVKDEAGHEESQMMSISHLTSEVETEDSQ